MTRFHVEMDVTCPSNWTVEDCRHWISKVLSTEEERSSLKIDWSQCGEMIRERVRAGVKNAQAKGVKFGRPRRVFDKEAAEEMRLAGTSVRNIALALDVTKGAIQRFIAERKKA